MLSKDSIISTVSKFQKVIVELGIGDGQLLQDVVKRRQRPDTCYVGIEIDEKQIQLAGQKLREKNVYLINESFEKVVLCFPDNYVDEFILVLPSPDYIDKSKESQWSSFYRDIFTKLKVNGSLLIITEIINDLLEPVTDYEFKIWKNWLIDKFISLGFVIRETYDDSPKNFRSRYLEQFKGDKSRIKIVTLILTKPHSLSN
ncbi:MAG TPA: methyltransferase domain-containing protein [Nitrososphaeraceae archaeon]|nr:methyltransferase domain-containing protein [Nitrososphaeraceae archaeon]